MFLTSREIIEVLDTLPEPVRTLAIWNHVKFYDIGKQFVAEKEEDFLFAAFVWERTPQGYEYWMAVYSWIQDRGGKCPVPISS